MEEKEEVAVEEGEEKEMLEEQELEDKEENVAHLFAPNLFQIELSCIVWTTGGRF